MSVASQPSRSAWQGLTLAAALVVLCLLALGLWAALAPPGMTPKSLQFPGAALLAGEAPLAALLFYLGDSLFVVLAFWLFCILARLAEGPGWLLALGLASALLKAGSDGAENLGLAWPALEALGGGMATPLIEDRLALLDGLKRIGGSLAAVAFAPLYPGSLAVRLLLYATGMATAAGFLFPLLLQANAAFLFVTVAAMIWDGRRHAVS